DPIGPTRWADGPLDAAKASAFHSTEVRTRREPTDVESTSEHVVVVGQGYVGLPVAMRAVHGGYDVVGFEVDPAKVDALNEGRSHVEDITAEMLRTALDTGRYRASADPADLA